MRLAVPASHSLKFRAPGITRSTRVQLRFNSSSQQASKKAQDAYSSAQQNAEKVVEGAKKFGNSVGGRLGSLLGGM